jgi:hypothetical protein
MTDTIPKKMAQREYERRVIKKCEDNHIWLNKMTYLYPSQEEKIKLADTILEKLMCKSSQLPSEGIVDEDASMRKLAVLTPVLYLKVNWS